MSINRGVYYTFNSDLAIEIMSIYYTCEAYFKCKARIYNRFNNIVYEEKGYKIYYDNISHWKKYS